MISCIMTVFFKAGWSSTEQ